MSGCDNERNRQEMAMLRICTTDGCETKTLGDQCLEHEHTPASAPLVSDAENQLPLEPRDARVPALS
jgi:hypothetical protein